MQNKDAPKPLPMGIEPKTTRNSLEAYDICGGKWEYLKQTVPGNEQSTKRL